MMNEKRSPMFYFPLQLCGVVSFVCRHIDGLRLKLHVLQCCALPHPEVPKTQFSNVCVTEKRVRF